MGDAVSVPGAGSSAGARRSCTLGAGYRREDGPQMKAVTVRQPWASLLVIGAKKFETRTWPTNHRGRLAIHAASKFGPFERHVARTAAIISWLRAAGLDENNLPRAAVLGTVEVVTCVRTDDLARLSQRQRMMGDFRPGRWAWEVANARVFSEPVPACGNLSLWAWRG